MSRLPRSPILPAGYPILPAGHPDENVYIPWVPHRAHKLLTLGHRSGDPWPPGRETPGHPVRRPPPPGQSPQKFVYPVLPFLAFLEKGKENHQKNKDFYPYRTPEIPGKEGKNAQKNKEFLAEEKSKEFQKSKERKDRVCLCAFSFPEICGAILELPRWKAIPMRLVGAILTPKPPNRGVST